MPRRIATVSHPLLPLSCVHSWTKSNRQFCGIKSVLTRSNWRLCDSKCTSKRSTVRSASCRWSLPTSSTLSSPSRRKITSRIFVACLPDSGRVQYGRDVAPLLLSQICRQWREIAISSPELWASVDLYFPSEKRVEDNGPLPLLNVCFSRAKRRLLPVTIRTNYNDIPRLLLSLLSSVAARLHTVELSLSQKDFQYLARDNIEFPNLKRLALVAYKDRTAPDYDPLSIFGNAPSLADLNVQSQPRDAILDTYPLLTSIELGYVHVHAVLAMLHRYPRLLHFTAQIKHDGSAHRGDQPLLVPRLESLVIYGPDIDFLSAPNLRRLEFDTGWRGPVFSTLLPFLARSSCILDHLSFNIQHEDSESDFLACLKAVPALSSLQIDVCKDDRFIRMINCDPPVVPQLQMLQISASYEKFDYLAFTQLLQLRRDDIGPLTQLHSVQLELEENEPDYAIDEDSWLPESVTIEFDKLVAGGLKLRVTLDDRYVWSKGGDIDVCEDFP
ncbi:hypothetical protein DFH06DRAFT_576886 [Mycena polygramma]|nr:hypothetical protein DFH06DRAFT_576886 [Mycena polygramma]